MRAARAVTVWVAVGLAAACGGDDGPGAAADSGPGAGDDGGTAEPDPLAESAFVFDESEVRTYDITVADADWAWLQENALLEEYVPATVEYAGNRYGQVGLRYKGGYGSLQSCFDAQGNRTCDKLSLKLDFHELVEDGRFYGLKKVNLHSMESDPSKMHDAIGYRLFRDHGVFAPRTAFANVVVNGEHLGVFAVVEQIDGRFTRSRFSDGGTGNLYKEVWPMHASSAPYLAALETNEDEGPSVDKMLRFSAALSEAGDEGFLEVLGAWTDVDHYVTYLAIARLIDHWDGVVAWYCAGAACFNHNFYWYESSAADRVWLVPWDLDHTFEEPSPIRTYFGMPDWDDVDASCEPIPLFAGIAGRAPACDPLLRRTVTQLWEPYAERSRELLDGAFSVAAMNARIDELAAILEPHLADDPDIDLAQWRAAVDALRATVEAKRAHVEAKL